MQIERNLSVPLRSLVERVVDSPEQVSPSHTLINKDQGQRKQSQDQGQAEHKARNPESDRLAHTTPKNAEATIDLVPQHRIDILA